MQEYEHAPIYHVHTDIYMHTLQYTHDTTDLRTRKSPTVKVYCSSCHVKSCCSSMAVHVKKAFL